MRYAILVAYNGAGYGGWQIQKNSITVQEKLEAAAKDLFGKRVCITAEGRTAVFTPRVRSAISMRKRQFRPKKSPTRLICVCRRL